MDIPRPEKILVAMFRLSGGTNQPLEYEDIVVKSWQLFPDEFGLRKYVHKYPDSSDQHKPLYGPLKDKGYVLSGNKKFRLTEKGLAYATQLERVLKGDTSQPTKSDRLSRDKEAQIKRILSTDAFHLFAEGQKERIALFVDGCFWHGCPKHGTKPKGNAAFWRRKFSRNQARDKLVNRALRKLGWQVLRVWEHELARKHESRLFRRIQRKLIGDSRSDEPRRRP